MITFLSAGPGASALIRGARQILYDSEITVVASTAGNCTVSGSHFAPEIDTAVYFFAGILDTGRGWGIKGDTYATHNYLPKVGGGEPFPVGDRARAVQIARAALLSGGKSLTEAVGVQSRALNIGATVLPATDAEASLLVDTGTERLPLFFYRMAGSDTEVRELVRTGPARPPVTDEVRAAIEASDAVVIGPAHPAASVLSILDCEGMRDLLRDAFVVAVSPFRGSAAPDPKDAALMYAAGEKPTSPGVFRLYRDFVDVFVQDIHDPDEVKGSLRLETRLLHERQAESLAWDIMAVIRHAVS
ncbi:2-phospho-L-lactate transferase [Methanoculleus sp. Wushi-C6]|uniref:2-phospho-L-lactate transferase n=1 Tax=Methanoculleus caldifontis TaxID=2651577 RepID=A0ABU3WXZ7_9EURY|nr:2-phospho-L-lactate transferase CofD family protein [Methanoculleus sp. Wushi-C6]MDV2480679.1 2-phospho-L-lactate transferase [Methanoculleus sp. Wushi-C6]